MAEQRITFVVQSRLLELVKDGEGKPRIGWHDMHEAASFDKAVEFAEAARRMWRGEPVGGNSAPLDFLKTIIGRAGEELAKIGAQIEIQILKRTRTIITVDEVIEQKEPVLTPKP